MSRKIRKNKKHRAVVYEAISMKTRLALSYLNGGGINAEQAYEALGGVLGT